MINTFLLACPSCAQAFQEGGGNAAGYAILFMLGIIVPVMIGIFFFIVRIAWRQKKYQHDPFEEFIENS